METTVKQKELELKVGSYV